ncbi:hypothetical protein JCM5350_003205 [Sporobolomyces pararoseus]
MFYYLCRIINVTSTILYPTYASYKALKSTTTSSSTTSNSSLTSSSSAGQQQTKELERWTRYWCVIGLVWIYQDWFEWSFNWLPFYFEFKTLFLLWTVLPQIQGSTYLYEFHLSRLIQTHESKIDQVFGNLNQKFKSFGLEVLNRLIKNLRSLILGEQEEVVRSRGNFDREEGGEGRVLKNLLSWVLTTTSGGGNATHGNDQTGNFLRVATNALLHPPTTANPTEGREERGKKKKVESKLRKKQRLERELAALNYSISTSSSDDDDGDDQEEEDEEGLEDEDEEDSSLLCVPRFSNSSSSSSTPNLSKTRLRKPRSRRGDDRGRYVESKLEGGSKESVYEDLGSFETRRELEDYPSKSTNSAGWFGWGGTPDRGKVQNQKGKRD